MNNTESIFNRILKFVSFDLNNYILFDSCDNLALDDLNNNNVDNSSHRQQLAHPSSLSHNFRFYRETHRDTDNFDSNSFNFIINYKSIKINEKENKYKKNKKKKNEYKKNKEKMNQDEKKKYLKNH